MKAPLVHAIVLSGILTSVSVPAVAQPHGFLDNLAARSAERVERFGQPTQARVLRAGDKIARNLEHRPEDVREIDDVAEALAKDTARSLEAEATGVVGGVMSDAVNAVFGLLKRPQQ